MARLNREQIIHFLTMWKICHKSNEYSKLTKNELTKMFVDELSKNVFQIGSDYEEKPRTNKKKVAAYASTFFPPDGSDEEEVTLHGASSDICAATETKDFESCTSLKRDEAKVLHKSYVTIESDDEVCNTISPYSSTHSVSSLKPRKVVSETLYGSSDGKQSPNFVYKTPPPKKKRCGNGRNSSSPLARTTMFNKTSPNTEGNFVDVPIVTGGFSKNVATPKSACSGKTALKIYMEAQKRIGEKKKQAQMEKNEQMKKQGEGKLKIVIGRSKIVSEYDDVCRSDYGEHKFVVVIDMIDVRRNLVLWCYNGDYMVEVFKIFAIEVSEMMYSDMALSLFRRDNSNPNSIMTTPTQFPMKGVCLCVVCQGYPRDAEEKFSQICSQLKELITGFDFYEKYKAGVDGYSLANPNDGANGQNRFKEAMDRFVEKKQSFYWLNQEKDHFFEVQKDVDISMYFRDEDIKNIIFPLIFNNAENHHENPFEV